MRQRVDVFPPHLFRRPVQSWKWSEDPLKIKVMSMEAQARESLRKALSTDLTKYFVTSLYLKTQRNPPENINLEIKGETRSSKSTTGIFLGKLISYWWGLDFTEENILPNQGELLYKLKDAKYGETFLVDEQTPESFGEGKYVETDQLGMNLNICAKKCNNLIFIYPPHFTMRNAPYGLETLAKDTTNKYTKLYYHDLSAKAFGFGGIWPQGIITLPKYQDEDYQKKPKRYWSEARLKNFEERDYDYDSQLEENYELKKDKWIEQVRGMESGFRNKKKEEIATELASDERFVSLKTNGQREAFITMLMNRGKVMDMAKTEIDTVANMAKVIIENGEL